MALVMSYTDASGNSLETSFWRVVQINISAVDRNIRVVFYGYKDGDSFVGGKAPLNGAMKSYDITGSDFNMVAAMTPTGNTLYSILANAAESYAIGKKDVDSGQKDADNQPIMVSFFENATQA